MQTSSNVPVSGPVGTHAKAIMPNGTVILLIEFQKERLEPDGKIHGLMKDRPQFEAAIQGGQRLLTFGRERGLQTVHSGLRFPTSNTPIFFDACSQAKRGRDGPTLPPDW
jgi:hypothetical protein